MDFLNKLVDEVHKENERWWLDLETSKPKERSVGEMCMLMVSEVAEAMEGARKDLMDDKLPHRKMLEVELADVVIRLLDFAGGLRLTLYKVGRTAIPQENIPTALLHICNQIYKLYGSVPYGSVTMRTCKDVSTFEHTEMCTKASAVLGMVSDFCVDNQLDLWGAVEEKRAYNRTRIDHTIEHRKSEGGKKW
jgi:NTP pyrophosphatase (non-canonical NTP hydrolase)